MSTKQALAETVAMQHKRIDKLEAQLAEARKETLAAKARMNMLEEELMLRDARNET